MKFSNYAIDWLFEGTITGEEMNEYIMEYIKKLEAIKYPPFKKLAKFIKDNINDFAFKTPADGKACKLLQYNKYNTKVITGIYAALASAGDYWGESLDGKKIFLFNKPTDNKTNSRGATCILRATGEAIETYRGGRASKGAQKTNYQEIGVLIWLSILKASKDSLADFNPKTKIFVDNQEDIKKALDWLEAESIKKDGWCEQCKVQAQTILKHIPKAMTGKYELHQGGTLFNAIRTKGQKLSKVPGTADKWNPSDIYFIDAARFKLEKYNNILELNSVMARFDEIIGVSLKGSRSSDGSTSVDNIFELMGLDYKLPGEYPVPKDRKLTDEMKSEIKMLIKKIQSNATKCPYGPVGLYLTSANPYEFPKGNNLDDLLNLYVVGGKRESVDWGKSYIPSLHMIAKLDSKEKWVKFVESGYALATSQTSVSAPHWKVTGNGTCTLRGHDALDFTKLTCGLIRIPIGGETSFVFDGDYNGTPQRFEFRSRKSKPLLGLYTRPADNHKFKKISDIKIK